MVGPSPLVLVLYNLEVETSSNMPNPLQFHMLPIGIRDDFSHLSDVSRAGFAPEDYFSEPFRAIGIEVTSI